MLIRHARLEALLLLGAQPYTEIRTRKDVDHNQVGIDFRRIHSSGDDGGFHIYLDKEKQ